MIAVLADTHKPPFREVGHWAVLGKLNESAAESSIAELVEWALPIQERHFSNTKDCSLQLAGEKDPYEES